MGISIAEQMRVAGRTTGFDYMRVALATSIIFWHAISISYGTEVEIAYWRGPIGMAMHFVLPMFFALSGFLVAGSLDRCPTLVSFFGLRVLRIVPALRIEVTLSAIIFGPALTSYTLGDYFSDQRFRLYFLNILGEPHYVLPGLFEHNPIQNTVNAQLWTIPYELQCYLALGGLATAAILRRRSFLLVVMLMGQALWIWEAIKRGDDGGPGGSSGPVLVISFLVGILFHLYRDRIRLHWTLLLAALAGGLALSSLPHGAYYLPIPATYVTVYVGLLNPRPIRLVSRGDYSYGLYLYGVPLQQAIASYGPEAQHWWINVAMALPASLLVAVLSWHIVERPVLALRRHLPAVEGRLVRLVSGRPVEPGASMSRGGDPAPPVSWRAALAGLAMLAAWPERSYW
jgi:peptidoglycan/LPS O-acetylase OafA/YrhL